MKHFFLITLTLTLMAVSCRKDIKPKPHESSPVSLMAMLKDSMRTEEFNELDSSKVIVSYAGDMILVRLGFINRDFSNEFVLIRLGETGELLGGKIIHLQKDKPNMHEWNGYISITDLRGTQLLSSAVDKGYINAFHLDRNKPLEDPYVTLPEVIIVSTYGSSGFTSQTWYNLPSFLTGQSGLSTTGYYSNSNGGAYPVGTGTTTPVTEETIKINYETQFNKVGIEVEKFMKCFSNIPDAGATGSIEIFTDIPVDGDPSKFFNWENGSPGHVFIQLHKENGSASATQNIGFYPVTGFKTTLTTAPIAGKFVENNSHEFNASMKINLNATQVKAAVTRILYLARFVNYDIDDYNCANWALDVFNEAVKVEERLTDIPLYTIPGGVTPKGSSTPQGIFRKLIQLSKKNATLTNAISFPLVGWVGTGTGPCN